MAGVLIFDTLPGLFIGIGVSLVLLLYRASRPCVAMLGRIPGDHAGWADVQRRSDAEQVPGVVVLRPETGLFFANADHIRATIRSAAAGDDVHAVVLDAETIPYVDVTAAEALARVRDELRRDGVELLIARDVGQVRDVLARTGEEGARRAPVYRRVADAVADAEALGGRQAVPR